MTAAQPTVGQPAVAKPQPPTTKAQEVPPLPPVTPEMRAMEAFARGVQLADADPQAAIAALRQAVQANPGLHVAYYNLGVLHERVGDAAAAERDYQAALKTAPDYGPALNNLVNLYLRQGRVQLAVDVAGDAAARHSARLDLRNLKVKSLIAAGRDAEATREAKAILREDEKNVAAMIALSSLYYKQRKYELAAHALRLALKVDPENPEVHHRLGHVLLALDEKARARESFQKAVELKPDFPEALNSLAVVLLEANEVGRALNYLQEAVRLSPGFVAAHLNLGNAYRKAADLAKAKAAYETVLKLRAGHPDAIYNLAILYLDHPMPDAPDEIKRLEVALSYFGRYRDVRGLAKTDPASRYAAEAARKLAQLRKAEQRRIERERLKKLKKELEGQKLRMGGK